MILVISAIAIPSLLKSVMASHETSAVASLRTVNTSLAQYSIRCPLLGFPATLDKAGPGSGDCTGAGFLDSTMGVAAPIKSGYSFTYVAGAATGGIVDNYTITAQPLSPRQGSKYYFSDESGVIHWADGVAATAASPAL